MELAKRFRNDDDVKAAFGNHPNSTLQFISTITPHKELAESFLLDPLAARSVRGYCPLTVEHTVMAAKDARQAAQDVRDVDLQQRARRSSPTKHTIDCSSGNTKITIRVHEYSVPVAYKALGLLMSEGTDSEKKYAIRVIWERHVFAIVIGEIVREYQQFSQQDGMLVAGIQQFQGKLGPRAGDPLPIADFLAQFVLQKRGIQIGSLQSVNQLPQDVRDLITADEVETDVNVVEDMSQDNQTKKPEPITLKKAEPITPKKPEPITPKKPITMSDVQQALANIDKDERDEEEEDEEEEDEIQVTFRNK